MSYHQFENENGEPFGSFEVFQADAEFGREIPAGKNPTILCWYWQACFPGCLPGGEASGPFDTKADAFADARHQ